MLSAAHDGHKELRLSELQEPINGANGAGSGSGMSAQRRAAAFPRLMQTGTRREAAGGSVQLGFQSEQVKPMSAGGDGDAPLRRRTARLGESTGGRERAPKLEDARQPGPAHSDRKVFVDEYTQ